MSFVCLFVLFLFSSIRRHTRCALVTGVQTCALPIFDEGAALCIDSDGVGRLYPGEQDGFAWLVRPTQAPGRLERGQPLEVDGVRVTGIGADSRLRLPGLEVQRSEEHTSELQSLMRISYAVFCLKKTQRTNRQS